VAAAATEYGIPGDIPVYGSADDAVPIYGSPSGSALRALAVSVPGVPVDDYPIFAEVPESAFSCEGQVDGGFYADPEAKCQAFHICANDGHGGLAKYSFLCPNGTIFNQNYFICDWWFNFDCNGAVSLSSRNQEIAAERDAASRSAFDLTSYGAPPTEDKVQKPSPASTPIVSIKEQPLPVTIESQNVSKAAQSGQSKNTRRTNKNGGRHQG
jgi:hypothetical protein